MAQITKRTLQALLKCAGKKDGRYSGIRVEPTRLEATDGRRAIRVPFAPEEGLEPFTLDVAGVKSMIGGMQTMDIPYHPDHLATNKNDTAEFWSNNGSLGAVCAKKAEIDFWPDTDAVFPEPSADDTTVLLDADLLKRTLESLLGLHKAKRLEYRRRGIASGGSGETLILRFSIKTEVSAIAIEDQNDRAIDGGPIAVIMPVNG